MGVSHAARRAGRDMPSLLSRLQYYIFFPQPELLERAFRTRVAISLGGSIEFKQHNGKIGDTNLLWDQDVSPHSFSGSLSIVA